MSTIDLPRPQVGDVMERLTLDGQIEESAVISLKYHQGDPSFWNAVLVTRNGFEFVSCHADHRGQHDWRPKDWVFSRKANSFVPAGTSWNAESGELELPESFVLDNATPEIPVPPPVLGEKYMSWRARCYESVPELKGNPKAPEALSVAWKSRELLNN
jgi:hypothetical protein